SPAFVSSGLALAAHLVQPDREERRDQREARGEWEDEGHHAVPQNHARHDQADDRIEQAEEDHIGAIGAEIFEAVAQHVPEVLTPDALDCWNRTIVPFPGALDRMSGRIHRPAGILQRIPTPFDWIANVWLHGHGGSPSALEGAAGSVARLRSPVASHEEPRSTTAFESTPAGPRCPLKDSVWMREPFRRGCIHRCRWREQMISSWSAWGEAHASGQDAD